MKKLPRNPAKESRGKQPMEAVTKSEESKTPESFGWIKAIRSEEAMELIKANPLAYVLASVIAFRARWRDGFNRYGLGQGEAMLGDFENYGMTQQEYRTAKTQLEKWKFATFRATNKGSVGKLVSNSLFSVSLSHSNDQKPEQATSSQRPNNEQPTTNEERIDDKNGIHEERLNDATVEPGRQPSIAPLSGHRLSASIERELMARLRTLLGDDEMRRAGGNWRENWVRKHPSLVERGLNDLDSQIKEGKTIRNRAAWLVDLLKRWKAGK